MQGARGYVVNEGIYRRLLILHAVRELGQVPTEQPLSDDEVRHLFLHASAYALSESADQRIRAYDIASRLAELFPESQGVLRAVRALLARLGNFPARSLLAGQHGLQDASVQDAVTLDAEQSIREAENTVQVTPNKSIVLTDFQCDLLRGLETRTSLSASAPTSSGKSFVLVHHAASIASHNPSHIQVFLVPTRALIRQLVRDLRKELLILGRPDYPVRSVPLAFDADQPEAGCIYVLTQERLLSLLFSPVPPSHIDVVYVDEAQSLADEARGVLLHAVLDHLRRLFPQAQLHFSAPLVSNPEHFQRLFSLNSGAGVISDTFSPVTQNIIAATVNPFIPGSASLRLLHGNESIPLGLFNLGLVAGSSAHEALASFAQAVGRGMSSTIVYCNSPPESEEVAKHLAAQIPESVVGSQPDELVELISYLSSELHPDYPLISTLKKNVAFHYADMPANVRARVEDLASAGVLTFICCTSTLLQGVNLPARHLVLRNPRRGRDNPMTRPDFLNLAGRAGRLAKELHGNVWCINTETWGNRCFEGAKTHSVASALEPVLVKRFPELLNVMSSELGSIDGYSATVVSKINLDHVLGDIPLNQGAFYKPDKDTELGQIVEKLRALGAELPVSVYEKNMGIPLNRLHKLARIVRAEPNLTAITPLVPSEGPEAYPRLLTVFEYCWRHLEGQTSNEYLYYVWLATEWMNGSPLSEIIAKRIRRMREHNEDTSNPGAIIRSLLEDINEIISFVFVRDVRAYLDIIRAEMVTRGMEEDRLKLRPIDIYLECGAHQPQILSILALGLSRSTSIELSHLGLLPRGATPEHWLKYLQSIRIDDLHVSTLAAREIKDHLGLVTTQVSNAREGGLAGS